MWLSIFKSVVRLRGGGINRIEMKEHGKYHFDFWRPFQAIRKAALDDNPATSPDLTWTPLISAPYPENPSGHLGLDSSHTTVLRMFFGNAPAGGYQITSSFVNPGGPATRMFAPPGRRLLPPRR
jgi:hypothetical protein